MPEADLSASLDAFWDAVRAFSAHVADIAWGYLAAALLLTLAMQLVRAHGWANAVRAAYPASRVSETRLAGSFLVGAGLNGVLPAHGGDAIKIVLAKRGIERASYPTIISSLAVLGPFDAVVGAAVLLYAISQGLLPQPPQLPDLPAFEISYWAAHPVVLLLVLAGLGIGALVLLGFSPGASSPSGGDSSGVSRSWASPAATHARSSRGRPSAGSFALGRSGSSSTPSTWAGRSTTCC